MVRGRILIVEDDVDVCRYIKMHLMMEEDVEAEVEFAHDRDTALQMADKGFDLIISDLWLPDGSGVVDKEGGLRVMERALESDAPPEVIVITGHSSTKTALEATRMGAFDYIVKPIDYSNLVSLIKRALESRERRRRAREEAVEAEEEYEIIGSSPKMIEVMKEIGRLARSDVTVLIQGESGTGKELVARMIHRYSPRRRGPFVPVNVSAIPSELMEAELFGIGRRVATGVEARPGFFMQAQGGTLFLDEIGELGLDLQPKLLRAIDFKEIQRVGGETVKVDVRIIAATNKNLKEAVERGEFRSDLYYRLSGAAITLPPLRERREDIPLLAEHFLKKYRRRLGREEVEGFSEEVMGIFMRHSWPGNVRELENAVKYAISTCRGTIITPDDLPAELREIERRSLSPLEELLSIDSLKEAQERFERLFILRKLRENNWNISLTAKKLGITRQQLHKKIKKLKLRKEV